MPLGVFALAQEEKGEPVMFFQISVNREGLISGGYESTITGDQKPIAGQVDKETQNVAWRIGENKSTVFTTTLANLTQDVSTVAIHFGGDRVQTWLLVRMPEPPPAGRVAEGTGIDPQATAGHPHPGENRALIDFFIRKASLRNWRRCWSGSRLRSSNLGWHSGFQDAPDAREASFHSSRESCFSLRASSNAWRAS